ncbi:aminotransferase class I/II-fold pyridoxal phosphate-dependent enzyme [Brucella intermedia]|uniref:threonine aldolase family protein n=1 Tax=Brucella TaxID=234 RepID=UPI0009466BE2|nr:threonine aldolase family protein [Brucella intermedia]
MIDLRSDTLTRPDIRMLSAISAADIGDDCYGEDRTVRDLEEFCADMFGKERAVLLPSGTMSNQIALRMLMRPGDELICDTSYHINFFEASPTVDLAKVSINAVGTKDGILRVQDIEHACLERARWQRQYYRHANLIWLENTINGHGGRIYPETELKNVKQWADAKNIPVFIDGARLLNASAATGISPRQYGQYASSLSFCFAKGLGAPMGAMLMGEEAAIEEARRFRKWYGGGLHQAGIFAAAAAHALRNNREQLALDNHNAAIFFKVLSNCESVRATSPETNIVMFDIDESGCDSGTFVGHMAMEGVKLLAWRGTTIRCVFSNLVTEADARIAGAKVVDVLHRLTTRSEYSRQTENAA